MTLTLLSFFLGPLFGLCFQHFGQQDKSLPDEFAGETVFNLFSCSIKMCVAFFFPSRLPFSLNLWTSLRNSTRWLTCVDSLVSVSSRVTDLSAIFIHCNAQLAGLGMDLSPIG